MERRRPKHDRRATPTSILSLQGLRGRRRHLRRAHDYPCENNIGYYVDWYSPSLFYISLATLLLCCTDAHLTLRLLATGAEEINVFMDVLIRADPFLFVSVKLALTSVALIVLVAHHNFRIMGRIAVRHVLTGIFLGYLGLFFYELALFYA